MTQGPTMGGPPRRGWLGWPGLTVALFALAIAAGGPWLADRLDPPAPKAELAVRIKGRLVATLRGQLEARAKANRGRWSRWLPGIAVGLGVLGASLGALGWVRREQERLCGAAVAVGAAAVVFPYAVLLAGAVLLLLLAAWLVSVFRPGG